MYLANGSTTTLDGVTIDGNVADSQGVGGYKQNLTTVNEDKYTDYDDPGGKLFKGP